MTIAEQVLAKFEKWGDKAWMGHKLQRLTDKGWLSIQVDCQRAGGEQTYLGQWGSRWRFSDGSTIGMCNGSARPD